jgi:hypothetical protein
MCGAAIFWGILYPDKANSGPYLNSAHGNTAYGVDRTSLSLPTAFGYSKGNCAHCHEQHANIGGSEPKPEDSVSEYLLFIDNFNSNKRDRVPSYVQDDDVCFSCHIGTDTFQTPAFSNYSYSYTFGGCPASDCPTANIMDSFNSLSYHNLYDVWSFITGQYSTNFPAASNPCSGCHNVHIAQKSCGKPSVFFDTAKAAISKPGDHGNLWGDSSGEKMSDYTAGYQAPYYFGSSEGAEKYEPYGSSASEPSKLPDYVAFCTACHNANNTINSRVLKRSLHTINWGNEMHGGHAAEYCSMDGTSLLAMPYLKGSCGQYVLACTDCHEPHGSPNNFLVRKWVNNGIVNVTNNGAGYGPSLDGTSYDLIRKNKEWVWLCGKCHTGLIAGDGLAPHHDNAIKNKLCPPPADLCVACTFCHGSDTSGLIYNACSDCHFHGNWDIPKPLGGYIRWDKPLF